MSVVIGGVDLIPGNFYCVLTETRGFFGSLVFVERVANRLKFTWGEELDDVIGAIAGPPEFGEDEIKQIIPEHGV